LASDSVVLVAFIVAIVIIVNIVFLGIMVIVASPSSSWCPEQ
jgi:hypothetical protein